MIFEETDFRIGFKSYLEGPKKLQKSKRSIKYSNISGIFRQSKKLWDIETKKVDMNIQLMVLFICQ